MTREEFSNIVKGLKSVYAYDNFIKDKDAFDMWYALLSDLGYKQLSLGTQKYMQTSSKVPTPADLRKASILEDDTSEGEAWDRVRKAIANGAYGAGEEFGKLPQDIQKAIGSPSQLYMWATDDGVRMDIVQSQFLKSYRQIRERNRENTIISPTVLARLIGTQNGRQSISELKQ